MEPILETHSLAVGYRNKEILHGIDFTLRLGQMAVLIGPNGCGKSTLLRTLAGLQPPLAGDAAISGKDVAAYSRRELAQHTGAMHIPYDDIARAEALLESRRTPATFRIEGDSDALTVASPDRTWTISRQPSTDAQHFAQASARLCAYLAIPLSASLTPSEIVV